jgi:hypothetical protein
MEPWKVEAQRLIAEIETLRKGWTVAEQSRFDDEIITALGGETEGSYDAGYENGLDECEECEDKS